MSAAGRRFPRRSKKGSNKICTDWEAISLLVSGRDFVPPNRRQALGSRYDINMITFGARADDDIPDFIDPEVEVQKRGFALDEWQTVDHSVSGFVCSASTRGSASSTTRWSASSRATAASTCWARSAG
jgi:hypothetical protein